MAEKRKRGQNFTLEDKDKLVKLLLQHKETILNKKTDGATNESKTNAWIELTDSFNSSGTTYRYENLNYLLFFHVFVCIVCLVIVRLVLKIHVIFRLYM